MKRAQHVLALALEALAALAALVALAAPGWCDTAQVRIGLQYGLTYLPVMVAESENLFAKHAEAQGVPGLQVALHRFSGSTAMNEALLSGSIDVGSYGLPGLLIAWEKTRGRQNVVGLTGLAAINYQLFTNRPEVKSLADFGDQDKIAVPAFNSPQAILLRAAAEQRFGPGQAKRADALMVSMAHPDATAALLSGKVISGYFATPPFSDFLARDPKLHVVLTSRQILNGVDASAAAVGGSKAFFDKNPKLARALFDGLDEAMKLIQSDPARAAAIYVKSEQVRYTAAEVEQFIRGETTRYDVAPHGVMIYARLMNRQGMLKTVPADWKDVFYPLAHDRDGS